jgi:hypothetical protein
MILMLKKDQMTIIKRPVSASPKSADDFIRGAPDAKARAPTVTPITKGVRQGNQAQISLAMPPELLAKVDAAAARLSISRAAFMKMAITRAIDAEGTVR